jgi:Family of unknown function (DUF6683)
MLKTLLSLFASLVLACPALGQDSWASRDHDYASRQMNDFIDRFQRDLVNPVSRGVRSGATAMRAATGAAETARTAVPPRKSPMPELLATAYPADQRRNAKQTFEQLLVGYARIERQFGIAHYDVAGAAAAFIAGAYMGYRDTAVPDQHFSMLVQQMQQIIGSDRGFRNADVEAKQEMYERLAILGMLMANAHLALRRHPDAGMGASMRRTAGEYLKAFLKTDADLVQITAQGLVIR